MEKVFNPLSDFLFSYLKDEENLILSFTGEDSQFIRFNNATVRQTGLVNDSGLSMKFIANNRSCQASFTVSGNFDVDSERGKSEIDRMRVESQEIPEDPFAVFPSNEGSSREVKRANGLPFEDAVDSLVPAMSGMDFVGIWANGKIFRGNANSLGQKHWFETESFCLDLKE